MFCCLASVSLLFACKKETTTAPALPTVVTAQVSLITASGVTTGGAISSDGTAAVTGRGVVWGQAANPTIDLAGKTSDGSGAGSFTSTITGLQANTTYHIRAYAVSNAGTAYGNDISFTTSATIKVYVCGYELGSNDQAKLWVDNTGSFLPGTSLKSYASAVTVADGGDVYTAGWDFTGGIDNAKIWKNGVPTVLSTLNSRATGLFVAGSDVYVSGFEYNGSKFVAKYWKNGTATALSNGTTDAQANAICVVGSDVYVAGYENNGSRDVAKYWKNGSAIDLTNGVNYSRANAILVSAGDVYIAGYEFNGTNEIAKYWKNGTSYSLATNSSRANSIFVSGSDIYVAGYEKAVAKYWKNGVATSFTATVPYSAEARSICISGTDVYVAVTEYNGSLEKAKYYKNDVETILSSASRSGAFGIAVR